VVKSVRGYVPTSTAVVGFAGSVHTGPYTGRTNTNGFVGPTKELKMVAALEKPPREPFGRN